MPSGNTVVRNALRAMNASAETNFSMLVNNEGEMWKMFFLGNLDKAGMCLARMRKAVAGMGAKVQADYAGQIREFSKLLDRAVALGPMALVTFRDTDVYREARAAGHRYNRPTPKSVFEYLADAEKAKKPKKASVKKDDDDYLE